MQNQRDLSKLLNQCFTPSTSNKQKNKIEINKDKQKLRNFCNIIDYYYDRKMRMLNQPATQDKQMNVQNKIRWSISKTEKISIIKMDQVTNPQNKILIIQQLFKMDHFNSLVSLLLISCNIESIQLLSKIDMPHLKTLLLNDNYITEFRSFRKMLTPQLQNLFFNQNGVIQLNSLAQLYAPTLKYVCQQISGQNRENSSKYIFVKIMQSCNWIVKIQSKELTNLWLNSISRIGQTKILQCIRNRNSNPIEIISKVITIFDVR